MWSFFIIFLVFLSIYTVSKDMFLCPELPSLVHNPTRPDTHTPVKKKSNYLYTSFSTSGYLSTNITHQERKSPCLQKFSWVKQLRIAPHCNYNSASWVLFAVVTGNPFSSNWHDTPARQAKSFVQASNSTQQQTEYTVLWDLESTSANRSG